MTKYRVVRRLHPTWRYPCFVVQRKGWFFWNHVTSYRDKKDAIDLARTLADLSKYDRPVVVWPTEDEIF